MNTTMYQIRVGGLYHNEWVGIDYWCKIGWYAVTIINIF